MKRALIVGGSRGLGLGLAKEHLARGWHVTATFRTPSAELSALAPERLALDTVDVIPAAQTIDLYGIM